MRDENQLDILHAHISIKNRYSIWLSFINGTSQSADDKENPLIVDRNTPITEVSTLAMARPPEDLYDDVIVTKNNLYYGMVSIRELLLKLVDT